MRTGATGWRPTYSFGARPARQPDLRQVSGVDEGLAVFLIALGIAGVISLIVVAIVITGRSPNRV